MKLLVTGLTGYIGSKLVLTLWAAGHEVVVLTRKKSAFTTLSCALKDITVIEGDLLDLASLKQIPKDIDAAYYLDRSIQSANNFRKAIDNTEAKQVICISSLTGQGIGEILHGGGVPVTVLRVGMVIGAGSASFEIMRDLVESLPVMITPKWVESKCQPIAINDVLFYLEKVLLRSECMGKTFEIGGQQRISYRQLLLAFAKCRGIKRMIVPIPLSVPYLSSLWIYWITHASLPFIKALVNSLRVDVVPSGESIDTIISHSPLSLQDALKRAFEKIAQNPLVSSWEEAIKRGSKIDLECIQTPIFGTKKIVLHRIGQKPNSEIMNKAWTRSNAKRWGLSLSNSNNSSLCHVLLDDRIRGHLILYMQSGKVGEGWLEWCVDKSSGTPITIQTITFRGRGGLGRLYWLCFNWSIRHRCNRVADLIGPRMSGESVLLLHAH